MMRRLFGISFLLALALASCSKDTDALADGPDTVDRRANLLAIGASAGDLLTAETFNRLLVEVAYVEGFRPTAESLENLREFLLQRTFKQEVEYRFRALPSPGETSLTVQEVADLELENREFYNDGSTLAVYIYFADAPAEGDKASEGLVTLGAVYRNTSMVIHAGTLRDLASRSALITVSDVETTTLTHEFGHLFGLVNLGTEALNDAHEDVNSKNHCNVDGCLMEAELEFGSGLMGILEKRTAKGLADLPGLDAECLRDLQAAGGR